VGKGIPVVFLHGGLGLSHEYFRPFIDPLADSARLICYDQLGQGKSDRPTSYDELSFERLSSDCDALTRALGIEKFVLVGHSYGGFVALDFALRFPHRLAGLVLSCTAPDIASFVQRNPLGGTPAQQAALGELLLAPASSDEDLRKKWTEVAPLYYNNANPPAGVIADVDQRTIYSAGAFVAISSWPATTLFRACRRSMYLPPSTTALAISGVLATMRSWQRISRERP
jgi:proline iminopeptidase